MNAKVLAIVGAAAVLVAGLTRAAPPLPDNPKLKISWAGDQSQVPPFDKVLLAPVELEFRPVKPVALSPGYAGAPTAFPVSDRDREKMRQTFDEVFRDQLSKEGHFKLTDEAGPGVLVVKPAVRDIVSHVPPEEPSGRSRVYLDTVADATLVVDFVDGATGNGLGTAADRSTAEPAGSITTFGGVRAAEPTTSQEIRRLARHWAMSLDRRVEQLYFDAKPR